MIEHVWKFLPSPASFAPHGAKEMGDVCGQARSRGMMGRRHK